MSKIDFVVACPVWNRAWSLPLWFESLRQNVDPDRTALAFVVPPSDDTTRAAIARQVDDFAWAEILRDKNATFDRGDRSKADKHKTLAIARNRLLSVAAKARPKRFISWDSDILLHPGTIEAILRKGEVPVAGVWAWLNRRKPAQIDVEDPETGQKRRVQWEEPMQATAMQWYGDKKAIHLDGHEWNLRAQGWWRADVVLGFQMMNRTVYTSTRYGPHIDGEDIPFNWQLEHRSIPRYIYGESIAVHMYDHDPDEIALGWPGIMDLSTQVPLAAGYPEPRSPVDEALGFYPV